MARGRRASVCGSALSRKQSLSPYRWLKCNSYEMRQHRRSPSNPQPTGTTDHTNLTPLADTAGGFSTQIGEKLHCIAQPRPVNAPSS